MNQESIVEVINRDGWRKDYPLQKGIVYIGSAPTNDIVLNGANGGGVAPLHVQLIANQTGYKLINLGDVEIALGDGGQGVPPRAVMDLIDGQQFRLGEFTLVFRGGGGTDYYGGMVSHREGAGAIGLSVVLPHNRLAPHQSLEGRVRVQNLGGKTGVRFDIDLEGMDEECYDIAPGPLLSSGAERDVLFRIHHRGLKPLAGDWHITFRATAPNDYPGEEAVISEHIQVLPLYRHRLSLLPPGSDPPPLNEEEFLTPKAKGDLPSSERGTNSARSTANDWWTASPAAPEKPEAVRLRARQPTSPPADPASSSPATPAEPEESWAWTTTDPHEADDDQPVIIEAEGGDWGWESDEESEVMVAHSNAETAAETAIDDDDDNDDDKEESDKKKDTVGEAEPAVASAAIEASPEVKASPPVTVDETADSETQPVSSAGDEGTLNTEPSSPTEYPELEPELQPEPVPSSSSPEEQSLVASESTDAVEAAATTHTEAITTADPVAMDQTDEAPGEAPDDAVETAAEADEAAEKLPASKLEADSAERETATQDQAAEKTEEPEESTAAEEGWWTFEEEAKARNVIKLKADASSQPDSSAKGEKSPETETLWTAES